MLWRIRDFGGGAVYGPSSQLFYVRKALVVFVWACVPLSGGNKKEAERELSASVCGWLDSLQCAVPGACVMMVATHTDCAPKKDVEVIPSL